ncbi:MAG: nicotinate phosphoribosyltransferase [Pirellulaceae bacterium]|nr:nicotinate phosphoribosyltransferase [Pirellulaceae bacterium]
MLHPHSLVLLTDLYQLTMAQGYWKSKLADREAVFHLTFRRCPFGGQFGLACGLATVIDWLNQFRFEGDDLHYLSQQIGSDGQPLFDPGFLDFLRPQRFTCDVDALPEGTLAFPHEPLVRVRGPLWQAQVIETALLNIINFQTLIATKAARVCYAAAGQPVIDFGLRRAQGIDGGIAASRSAYIGGCQATSNVLAGRLFGIPIRGTHAHSWVMAFGDELAAFRHYAAAMPNNCVFLVDTYDTRRGVEHAIQVGRELRERGHELIGVRLDSGDQAELSIMARGMLDEAGFPQAIVVASSDLDEHEILKLKAAGARIDSWGVGTRLVTGHDQPALGGVYKLSALMDEDGVWRRRIKRSEITIKVSDPGILQVRRYEQGGKLLADSLYDELMGIDAQEPRIVAYDRSGGLDVPAGCQARDLLVPVFRRGKLVYEFPGVEAAREHAQRELARLDDSVRRIDEPRQYPVGLELQLARLKDRMIAEVERMI